MSKTQVHASLFVNILVNTLVAMVLGGIYGLTRYWWDLPIWGAITIALAGLAAILFGLYVLFWYLLARSIR